MTLLKYDFRQMKYVPGASDSTANVPMRTSIHVVKADRCHSQWIVRAHAA